MSTTIVSDASPEAPATPAPVAEAQTETVAEAAVEIAQIQADRDVEIAEVHAATEEARIEAQAETAETIAEASVEAAQTEQAEWKTELAAVRADVSSIRETLDHLSLPPSQPESPGNPEVIAASPVVPETAAPAPAAEPKPKKKPHRWI